MLQIGDQFDHFQILGHIAQGGMSDVYKAYDLLTSKEVVLKIPDKMSIGDPAQFERFQRELEVMETLRHPSIQLGLGSGRYNSTPYLVTELVIGKSMRDFVQSAAPVPPDQAVQLIRKIADGIAHCHDHGIIHRDLKPENILITDEGQPIILDFGLALTKKSYRVTYANLSSTAGTPDYMAPEQIEGQRGDQRTDLYAVGIMFFELLTGRVPFSGDNTMVVMSQHLHAVIPRLDREQPNITPQLAAVVMRCLERDPKDRYSDLHAFIHDLDNLNDVDISVLEKSRTPKALSLWERFPLLKPVGIAVFILLALIILAVILQSVRPK
jgi:serine/threonine-protein kinase